MSVDSLLLTQRYDSEPASIASGVVLDGSEDTMLLQVGSNARMSVSIPDVGHVSDGRDQDLSEEVTHGSPVLTFAFSPYSDQGSRDFTFGGFEHSSPLDQTDRDLLIQRKRISHVARWFMTEVDDTHAAVLYSEAEVSAQIAWEFGRELGQYAAGRELRAIYEVYDHSSDDPYYTATPEGVQAYLPAHRNSSGIVERIARVSLAHGLRHPGSDAYDSEYIDSVCTTLNQGRRRPTIAPGADVDDRQINVSADTAHIPPASESGLDEFIGRGPGKVTEFECAFMDALGPNELAELVEDGDVYIREAVADLLGNNAARLNDTLQSLESRGAITLPVKSLHSVYDGSAHSVRWVFDSRSNELRKITAHQGKTDRPRKGSAEKRGNRMIGVAVMHPEGTKQTKTDSVQIEMMTLPGDLGQRQMERLVHILQTQGPVEYMNELCHEVGIVKPDYKVLEHDSMGGHSVVATLSTGDGGPDVSATVIDSKAHQNSDSTGHAALQLVEEMNDDPTIIARASRATSSGAEAVVPLERAVEAIQMTPDVYLQLVADSSMIAPGAAIDRHNAQHVFEAHLYRLARMRVNTLRPGPDNIHGVQGKDDIVQEIVFKVHEAIQAGQYRLGTSIDAYITTAAKNTVVDVDRVLVRNNRPAKGDVVSIADIEHDLGLVEPNLDGITDGYAISYIRELLDPDRSEVLILASYFGFKTIQIAEKLGISEGTVKSRLSRGRKVLLAEHKAREAAQQQLEQDFVSRSRQA